MTSSAPISDRGDEPTSEVVATGASVRADVVRLVRERRYEEALTLLYAARADSPDSKELSASIRQIKEFLIGAYAKRLGGLDRIAGPVPATGARFPDALLVARYIDGASTFDDISRSCPLGRLRALQVLVAMYTGGESAPPPRNVADSLPPGIAAVETPPPPRALPRALHGSESERSSAVESHGSPWFQRERSSEIPRSDRSSVAWSWTPGPPSVDDAPPSTQRARTAGDPVTPVTGTRNVGAAPPSGGRTGEAARPAPVVTIAMPDSPEDALFKQAFARGTAAFVQRRFADAVDAFRECERIRPTDAAAATMLRRALGDAGRA